MQGFETTRWSLVVAAGGPETKESKDALAVLCQAYWYPLYAFLRRRGHKVEEAEDLVQAFLTRLLEKKVLAQADPDRGRFRAFLLSALKHFVANEFDRARAKKRGGGQPLLELDVASAEGRYALEPRDGVTPETLFERRWALTLIERSLDRLRDELAKSGKAKTFDALKGFLTGEDDDVPYRQLASELGQTEGALRVAVHRLRKGFRRQLEKEIAHTVGTADEIDAELRFLRATIGATSDDRPTL